MQDNDMVKELYMNDPFEMDEEHRKSYKMCCFTGYRPRWLPWLSDTESLECGRLYKVVEGVIEKLQRQYGVTRYITGLAQGFDLLAAEAVLRKKKQEGFEKLEVYSFIPGRGQDDGWPEKDKARRAEIIHASAALPTFVTQGPCDTHALHKRNEAMVVCSMFALALYSNRLAATGTGQTVRMAEARGLNIVRIDPYTMEVSCKVGKNLLP